MRLSTVRILWGRRVGIWPLLLENWSRGFCLLFKERLTGPLCFYLWNIVRVYWAPSMYPRPRKSETVSASVCTRDSFCWKQLPSVPFQYQRSLQSSSMWEQARLQGRSSSHLPLGLSLRDVWPTDPDSQFWNNGCNMIFPRYSGFLLEGTFLERVRVVLQLVRPGLESWSP